MDEANHRGKVFSKGQRETPIAVVNAAIFEDGPFWHGWLTVSPEELTEFGPGVDVAPEFLLQLEDGRIGTFVDYKREVRFGDGSFRLHVMGTKALA